VFPLTFESKQNTKVVKMDYIIIFKTKLSKGIVFPFLVDPKSNTKPQDSKVKMSGANRILLLGLNP
jgi:hypothetical protein